MQCLGEFLPRLAHHVLVVLEGLLQLEQLRGGEGRSDPLGLSEGKQELRKAGGTWNKEIQS